MSGEVVISSSHETEEQLRAALGETEGEVESIESKVPDVEAEEGKPAAPVVKRHEGQSNIDRRFDKLTKKNAELAEMVERQTAMVDKLLEALSRGTATKGETKVAEQVAATTSDKEPVREAYLAAGKSDEDWIKDHQRWLVKQEFEFREKKDSEQSEQERRKEIFDTYNSELAAYKAEHPDFEELMQENKNIKIPYGVVVGIYELENGAAVTHWLLKNPEKAKELNEMTDAQALMQVGVIAAALNAGKQPRSVAGANGRVISKAPTPPAEIRGSGASEVALDGLPYRDYAKQRRMQEKARRGN